ncbi:MAG: 50S ribosomal protein L29 [Candidatus Cloacimonadales bacterium]
MKASELRELTKEELQQKLEDFTEELFNLRFQNASNRLDNTSRFKKVKRTIARIKTLMSEK